MILPKYFKHIEPSKEERIQGVFSKPDRLSFGTSIIVIIIQYLYGSLAWPEHFFPFFFVVAEKGSGELLLAILCRESPDYGDC